MGHQETFNIEAYKLATELLSMKSIKTTIHVINKLLLTADNKKTLEVHTCQWT
jgi:hypothetical protein